MNVKTLPIPDFSKLFYSIDSLLKATVQTQDIKGLKEDKPLRDWVESGYNLHKERNLTTCQFCNNPLPDDLLIRLGNFFTDELQKVKNQIQESISALENESYDGGLAGVDSNSLFPEQSKIFKEQKNKFESQIKTIKEAIQGAINNLKDKKVNLHNHTKVYEPVNYPQSAITEANLALSEIEKALEEHNLRVDSISEEVQKTAEKIELHLIATMLRDAKYFENKEVSNKLLKQLNQAKKERTDLLNQIKLKKASLLNLSDAVLKINSILAEFFGTSHIYLEVIDSPGDSEMCYVLKRRNKDARHLSEGEESVLALVYFLIKLEEEGCNKNDCLIVVDDPVDSQDSIFLFRTAGLIKRQLNKVGQLILLTHNFEFFNLMRDWFAGKTLQDISWMYLISHDRNSSTQEVKIENLPELLKEYKSEYQYLFSRLYQFANNIESLDEPLVANIARKVLEYFAGFKWSCRTTEDFTSIVLSRFVSNQDHLKKGVGDFVVKFLHEYSHGQDFSRAITASMLEAKPIAQNVIKFIQLADSDHYNHLKALCQDTGLKPIEQALNNPASPSPQEQTEVKESVQRPLI